MKPLPQPSGLTQGLPLLIDPHWSPEQALAVIKLLDDLRARIWAHYELALFDRLRDDRSTGLNTSGVGDPPFRDPSSQRPPPNAPGRLRSPRRRPLPQPSRRQITPPD